MKKLRLLVCLTGVLGCQTMPAQNTIVSRDFEIAKIESVDLSAEDWLRGTIVDPVEINQIKQAILDAKKLEREDWPAMSHCQLRIESEQLNISIGYDQDQGLLKRISTKNSSVYQLSEESQKALAEIWDSTAGE